MIHASIGAADDPDEIAAAATVSVTRVTSLSVEPEIRGARARGARSDGAGRGRG